MRRTGVFIGVALMLSACGGAPRVDRFDATPRVQFSTGQIASACRRSGRDAASYRLCGCVQAAADRHLRGSDQGRAAAFFADPHQAQEVKMSQTARDDAFWDRYKAFAAEAERSCRGL